MQNVDILHFFENIFAHIKKKQYLCTVKLKNIHKQHLLIINKNYTIMARMKILRTFKVREKNNNYCIELVSITEKYCTYVTKNNNVKLWHMSDTHEEEKLYFNKVIANNIGYAK